MNLFVGFGVLAIGVGVAMFVVDALPYAGTKLCPECAERVKVRALICRHCGEALEV